MRRLIPLAAVLALALSGCGGASSSEGGDIVRVAHVPSPLFSPLYVAKSKGYFEDEGVEVQLNAVSSGQDAVPLLSSGQGDVIVAGFSAGFFSALDSGLKLKVVGSMSVTNEDEKGDPPAALEVASGLTSSGKVRTPADLAGRAIAVAGGDGGSGAYLTDMILREHGISIKDVQVSNISNADMPAAIESGSVDAALTSAPYTEVIEESGDGEPVATLPGGACSTGIIYSEDFANSGQAKDFFRAMTRAASDLQGDARRADANVVPVAEAMKVDPADIKKLPLFYWLPDLRPLPDQLEAMQRTWIDAGQLEFDKPIPTSEFMDSSFAESTEG